MSLTKRYMDDLAVVALWAASAAFWEWPAVRAEALSPVFVACGELAAKYPGPDLVAALLTREAVLSYATTRVALREAEAA
ncbi:hypothetical protein ACMA1D_18165 [Streptomyces sp. 796.1]|uniref:hypothetical protein n=1 Tax=Streptomyces sp. 796.1 TaxID=3163029 RepID=UPI0039C99BEB